MFSSSKRAAEFVITKVKETYSVSMFKKRLIVHIAAFCALS